MPEKSERFHGELDAIALPAGRAHLKQRYFVSLWLLVLVPALAAMELATCGWEYTSNHYIAAWRDAWGIVVEKTGNPLVGVLLLWAAQWLWDRRREGRVRLSLRNLLLDAGQALVPPATVCILFFFVHLLFITPKNQIDAANKARNSFSSSSGTNGHSAGNYPWLSMTASVTVHTRKDADATGLKIAIGYINRGFSPAVAPRFKLEVDGRTSSLDGSDALAPGDGRELTITMADIEATQFYKNFSEHNKPIICVVSYTDLNGEEYGMRYEWLGMGGGEGVRAPKVELLGKHAKLKHPFQK